MILKKEKWENPLAENICFFEMQQLFVTDPQFRKLAQEEQKKRFKKLYQYIDTWQVQGEKKEVLDYLIQRKYKIQTLLDSNSKAHFAPAFLWRAKIVIDCQGRKSIFISQHSINQLFEISQRQKMDLTKEQIWWMHLLHEGFHAVEYEEDKDCDAYLDVRSKSFFTKKRIQTHYYSEAGAHYYVAKMLRLTFHPVMLELS